MESKKAPDYKARLEKKLCLAREIPEPIFDLSNCNLKQVPSNIFKLCKVFRKEKLYLQNNLLSSMDHGGDMEDLLNIKILNISSNKFNKLTSDIGFLSNLEILDISKNQIEKLPSEIGYLVNLKYLDGSNNNLQSLPPNIGNCKSLQQLNLSSNKKLKQLPAAMGHLTQLSDLQIDSTIVYPPQEICQNGTQAILEFLRKDSNITVDQPSTSKEVKPVFDSSVDQKLQDQILKMEQLKEEKRLELMNFEEKQKIENLKQVELQQGLKEKKNVLVDNLRDEQVAADRKLAKLQEISQVRRASLIKACKADEKSTLQGIESILDNNKRQRNQVLDLFEKEKRQEDEKLMNASVRSYTDKARRQEIIGLMNEEMIRELDKYQAVNADNRCRNVQSIATQFAAENEAFKELMKKSDADRKHLTKAILTDEELQKSAVASMLEKSDEISWKLSRQIALIESKLAELSRLEVSKRKLETDAQITDLSRNRLALTEVLMNLFKEQDARRRELVEKIRRMEMARSTNEDQTDFWLEKYNLLLESQSYEMVNFLNSVDPNLVNEFFVNGVFQYLPVLKNIGATRGELKGVDAATLRKHGIKNGGDLDRVVRAIENYVKSLGDSPKGPVPSAPDFNEPSAPVLGHPELTKLYLVPDECVICLDSKPSVIFLPCGHICCCGKCYTAVTSCPICRGPITKTHETSMGSN